MAGPTRVVMPNLARVAALVVTLERALAVLFAGLESVCEPVEAVAVLMRVSPARSLPTLAEIFTVVDAPTIIWPSVQVILRPAMVQAVPLKVAVVGVRPTGRVSVTLAEVAAEPPWLVTTIVYPSVPPGFTVFALAFLVTFRSAAVEPGFTVMVALLVLLAALGSVCAPGVRVAVLVMIAPAHPESTWATISTWNPAAGTISPAWHVTVCPLMAQASGMLLDRLMGVRPAGSVSVSDAPVDGAGPLLATVMT